MKRYVNSMNGKPSDVSENFSKWVDVREIDGRWLVFIQPPQSDPDEMIEVSSKAEGNRLKKGIVVALRHAADEAEYLLRDVYKSKFSEVSEQALEQMSNRFGFDD